MTIQPDLAIGMPAMLKHWQTGDVWCATLYFVRLIYFPQRMRAVLTLLTGFGI